MLVSLLWHMGVESMLVVLDAGGTPCCHACPMLMGLSNAGGLAPCWWACKVVDLTMVVGSPSAENAGGLAGCPGCRRAWGGTKAAGGLVALGDTEAAGALGGARTAAGLGGS